MFLIELTYIADLAQLDAQLEAHVQFLDTYYETGCFIASGRKVPRTGGIILAAADSMEAIQQIIEKDPFYIGQLATYKITEFIVSKKALNAYDLMS